MNQKLQEHAGTFAGRHTNAFSYLAKSGLLTGIKERPKILCFGCSKGDEIQEHLNQFNPIEVIGVDLNQRVLKIAQERFKNVSNVHVIHSSKLNAKWKFDLITCCNVLCSVPATKEVPYIKFDLFKKCVYELLGRLNKHGALFVFAANYSILALNLPESVYELRQTTLAPGGVATFTSDGKSQYDRKTKGLIYVIFKK